MPTASQALRCGCSAEGRTRFPMKWLNTVDPMMSPSSDQFQYP